MKGPVGFLGGKERRKAIHMEYAFRPQGVFVVKAVRADRQAGMWHLNFSSFGSGNSFVQRGRRGRAKGGKDRVENMFLCTD